MILNARYVTTLMTLTAQDITAALERNEYHGDSVKTAAFAGLNTRSGSFVYNCTYHDTETEKDEDCQVYIHFNNLMQLVAEY